MDSDTNCIVIKHVSLIGFGEAGTLLGRGLAAAGLSVRAYDIKFCAADLRLASAEKATPMGVTLVYTPEKAIENADLIISAVTAGSAAQVAEQIGPRLGPHQFFLDINSVSPATKRHDQQAVQANGAHYVEAAVMAPIPPYGLQVPMLLGGDHAHSLSKALNTLGMRTRAVSEEIGIASAIKMCRSVMIKGMEALTMECLAAARAYNAEKEVLASLDETYPNMGWADQLPHYLISRIAEHGERRAAEMREVAHTLSEAQIQPTMALAAAQTHQATADQVKQKGMRYNKEERFNWPTFVDQLKR
jgi:3-hydroxyisobutyrate dehydrogenase-like beta-hydroxyacid dehydrogenase